MTDRCNLRCLYCMPPEGVQFIEHEEILKYEEILTIVRLAAGMGIRKVRVTGGEPLVRRGVINFLQELCKIQGLEDISITTNGVTLKRDAAQIKKCGIKRLNISLDTLNPERYRKITGRDFFADVWDGLGEVESLGFNPIKINVVVMRNINLDEIFEFARLTSDRNLHVRFIELMPFNQNALYPQMFVSIQEIFEALNARGELKKIENGDLDGPARRFRLGESVGEIGFIGSITSHLCQSCNRLRLTSDGFLKPCLFSDREIELKRDLRRGDHISVLKKFAHAIRIKSEGCGIERHSGFSRQMSAIGG